MLKDDEKMLTEIEEDFYWGKKASERGYLNLHDEQIKWMITKIKQLELQKDEWYEKFMRSDATTLIQYNLLNEKDKEIQLLKNKLNC